MRTLPQGPAALPVVQTARWLVRPIAFMESCRRRFGDAFSVRFVGFDAPMVMICHPEAIAALYAQRDAGLPPGRNLALRPLVGPHSLLLLQGGEHLARRRMMVGPFHGERMRAYEPIVRQLAADELANWQTGVPFALLARMRALTLKVILRAVFGVTDADRGHRLLELLPRLLQETSSNAVALGVLLARRLAWPDPLAGRAGLLAQIDALLLAEIDQRRRESAGTERSDILALLIDARFEDGSGMSDAELRDQLVTLLLAGHETTATAIAWTVELLLRNPAQMTRVTEDLDRGQDTYLRAVISESLRLRPVIPLAGRRIASELQVGELTLAPGTDVTPAIWLTHTRPDAYPEPYAFRPERFLQGASPTYAWIPFGGGVRRCLGGAFAEFEMRIVLQSILRRYSLSAAGARAERAQRRNVTLSPRHGTLVCASSRSGAAGPPALAEH